MTDESPEVPRRVDWRQIALVWALLTALSVTGSILVLPRLMPQVASSEMHLVVLTMIVFSVTAAPIGSFVYSTAFHWWRSSRHYGDTPPADGPALRGHNPVAITWLAVSGLLTCFLLVWGLGALATDDAAAEHASLHVDVTGQQWLWTYHYPGTKVTTEEPVVPEGKTVTFDVTSLDVTHSFWIVQMGVKVDANPGVVTTVSVTPTRLGTFDVHCAELCGLNHAFMVSQIRVVTPAKYAAWLAAS
jgi:cytochrome c oxidase subunit II